MKMSHLWVRRARCVGAGSCHTAVGVALAVAVSLAAFGCGEKPTQVDCVTNDGCDAADYCDLDFKCVPKGNRAACQSDSQCAPGEACTFEDQNGVADFICVPTDAG